MTNRVTKLFAGIEAGGTKFNCVIGTDPSNVIARTKIPTTKPEETLAATRDFFLEQARENGKLAGMGIACFGPLDLQKKSPTYGYITSTPKKNWSHTNIAGYFDDALNIPVGFDTDVNGSALGEYLYGTADGVDDFVYVTVGTGIGAGVYANGAPINGLIHTEIGHMLVARAEGDTFEGVCPFHKDCLTGMASGPAIEARWKCPGSDLPEDHQAWDLEAHYLGIMCVNITMAYSPRLIILGGGVMAQAHLFPKVRDKFERLMNEFMMPQVKLDQYIVPPGNPDRSGEIGALAIAMKAAR